MGGHRAHVSGLGARNAQDDDRCDDRGGEHESRSQDRDQDLQLYSRSI